MNIPCGSACKALLVSNLSRRAKLEQEEAFGLMKYIGEVIA
jgi:hypothetical protein